MKTIDRFDFKFDDGRTGYFRQNEDGTYSGCIRCICGHVESAATGMKTSAEAKQWIAEHEVIA